MENEKNPWKRLARKAVEAKAKEAQKARDLEVAVQELRAKLTTVEKERDDTVKQAQAVIGQRDEAMRHLKSWCEKWLKGEFSAIEVVAGFTAVLEGDLLAEPTILERRRAAENVRVLSLMTQAASRLDEIERLLDAEGIPNTESQVQQVRDLLAKHKGGEDA